MPVLNVTSFWLFALATSVFSAMNERELRQRRADLQSLVEHRRPSSTTCPIRSASPRSSSTASPSASASSAASSSAPPRAAIVVLAAIGVHDAPTTADRSRRGRRRSRGRARTSCRSAGSTRSATRCSTTLLPGARNVLVSPMIADGRPLGAVVVEHRPRPVLGGVERRVASVLGQLCVDRRAQPAQRRPAAPRPGPRRARLADRRGQPPDVPGQRSSGSSPTADRAIAAPAGHRGPVHRPRRLQGRQRHARPRRRATRCSSRSPSGSPAPSATATSWPASAATSSRS